MYFGVAIPEKETSGIGGSAITVQPQGQSLLNRRYLVGVGNCSGRDEYHPETGGLFGVIDGRVQKSGILNYERVCQSLKPRLPIVNIDGYDVGSDEVLSPPVARQLYAIRPSLTNAGRKSVDRQFHILEA